MFSISQNSNYHFFNQELPKEETNPLCTEFSGVISRLLIEKNFFQRSTIPQDVFLHLSNQLLKTLHRKEEDSVTIHGKNVGIASGDFTGSHINQTFN
jgi:hypothetical protein